VIVDDVLATGGTARAAVNLVEQIGGQVVAVVFFMELCFLAGRAKLAPYTVHALVQVQ
jgi:adenine phosphoribosyltransferase